MDNIERQAIQLDETNKQKKTCFTKRIFEDKYRKAHCHIGRALLRFFFFFLSLCLLFAFSTQPVRTTEMTHDGRLHNEAPQQTERKHSKIATVYPHKTESWSSISQRCRPSLKRGRTFSTHRNGTTATLLISRFPFSPFRSF